jgi:uncharacterized membrane protein YfcA
MDSTLLIVIAGAAVAGFVQGLSGFAFGMVAMSFWAWAIEPRLASAMTVFGALTGQLLAAASVRRGLSWRRLWPFVAGKGIVTREMLPMFLVVAPAMLVPTLLGTRLYLGISEGAFRKIVLTLLTVSGVALLGTSVPVLVGRGGY